MKRLLAASFALSAFTLVLTAPQSSAFERDPGKDAPSGTQVSYLDKSTYTNFERFVSALEDNRENAALEQKEDAGGAAPAVRGSYRNIHSQESIFAALEDGYTPARYRAIMDRSRFSALESGCAHADADLLGESAASYISSCR